MVKLGCIVMTPKLNKSAQTFLSPWPKTMCQVWCKTGDSCSFFIQEVVIHHECAAQNLIVHQQFYLELLGWLCDSVCHKWLHQKRADWWVADLSWQHTHTISQTTFHMCVNPHTPLTWPPLTFSPSPKSRTPWRALDLKTWKQSNLTQCSNICRSPKQY